MKRCSKCGESKLASEFSPDRGKSDGLTSACKACRWAAARVRAKANPERIARYMKQDRERHPERYAMHNKRYRETHSAERSAAARKRTLLYPEAKRDEHLYRKVYAEEGGVCYLCGKEIDQDVRGHRREAGTLDHVIPLSRGGPHTRANLHLAHFGCNARKGAKLISQGGNEI